MSTQLQKRIMRRVYVLAVLRALRSPRVRKTTLFAVAFALSSRYISYPNIFLNVMNSGMPAKALALAIVGAPGFKLALLCGACAAGFVLVLDFVSSKNRYEYA